MSALAAKNARLWERAADEWYVEPEDVTDALLTRETFHGRVWDPSCGGGNIPRSMRRHGIAAFGSDIVARGLSLDDGWLGEQDFFTCPFASYDNIVCNPPFGRAKTAEAFIRRALTIATRKVAVFVDMRFTTGAERAGGIYAESPPTRMWIITPRPSCPPGAWLAEGNTAGGGTSDYCWLVWDRVRRSEPTELGWISRPKVSA